MFFIPAVLGMALIAARPCSSVQLYSSAFGISGQNATFDYVVIGGGTAGNTIAARLAAAGKSVAVVEAGSFYQINNGNGSVIPGVATTQHTGSDPNDTQPLIDWSFVTVPQAGAGGRAMHYAQGKTLGGSSGRHYMVYHHGTTGSYQRWADEVGDPSYSFENLVPYFQRSVTLTQPNTAARAANASVVYNASFWAKSDQYHQPLNVGWGNWAPALGTWAQIGMKSLGIPDAGDVNSGTLHGYAWATDTIEPKSQRRESSQTSFLDWAIASTTGIQVYVQTMACRILFDGNGTATGVLVRAENQDFALSATKEVILSAGTFKSPQLLMLSGIGPANTLRKYKIPVLADRPGVGQNLWDQPYGFGPSYRVNFLTGSEFALNPGYAAAAAASFVANGTGPLASPPSFLAFERLVEDAPSLLKNSTIQAIKANFPSDWPDIEIIPADGYLGYNRNYITNAVVDGYNYATITPVLVAPLSRGNVTIRSDNVFDDPVINPNWLTAREDQDLAVAAFKRCRQIWKQIPNVTIGEEYLPGPNVSVEALVPLDSSNKPVLTCSSR
jgi:choline dehydrogenase